MTDNDIKIWQEARRLTDRDINAAKDIGLPTETKREAETLMMNFFRARLSSAYERLLFAEAKYSELYDRVKEKI